MRIPPAHQTALASFNAGVARARRDYTHTPTEFTRHIYCVTCSELTGTSRSCNNCRQTRWRRAKRKAAV